MDYLAEVYNILADYKYIKVSIENMKYSLALDSEPKLEKELKENEAIVFQIENCVKELPELHQKVIIDKYIGCLTWQEISESTGYSVSHCKRLHCGAVYKLSIGIYGVKAINKLVREKHT